MAESSTAELIEAATWFAQDSNGQVAAFWNGEIPTTAMAFLRQWTDVDDRILRLPATSEVRVLIEKQDYWPEWDKRRLSQQHRDALADMMWPEVLQNASALPARGIYQFTGEYRPDYRWPWTYKKIATPLTPINIDLLPEEIRLMIGATTFPYGFADVQQINVRGTS